MNKLESLKLQEMIFRSLGVILCFWFAAVGGQVWSQVGCVEGTVVDDQGLALVGAKVKIQDTIILTDISGVFGICLPTGIYSTQFSFVGFNKSVKSISISENEKTLINVTLSASETQLDELVVATGKFEQKLSELTVSMEVISPELVSNKSLVNPEDAMQQVPGVTVQEGQINIRGGSGFTYGAGSRVLVMLDDMPLLAGDAGDVKMNTLPLENLHQLEVMKGASSVLYGSSALNGVVNIRTAYPKLKPETIVNFRFGAYDNPFGKTKFSGMNGQDSVVDRSNNKHWQGLQSSYMTSFAHRRILKKKTSICL